MEELLEKIDLLKKSLDNEESIKKIRLVSTKIYNDKELLNKIEEYKIFQTDKLKYEIYNNENYREYKELETDINLLIMKINSKLKSINSKGKCSI